MLTAKAPAKLIISGEHAVLYDQPALAMAVDRYTTTTTTWRDSPNIHFKLLDLAYAKSHTYEKLRQLAKNLQQEYNNFLNGKRSIHKVLKRPFELLQYSVSNLLDYLNVTLPRGMEIAVDSSIPIGCGMGSSAAAVLSTTYALTNFLQCNWQSADYLSFSKQIENLQHGKSSGLDLHLVNYGGCLRFENGATQARPIPDFPMYIVNTGKPATSTGECVSKVAPLLQDRALAADFGAVTNSIDSAITGNNAYDFRHGIRNNHKLLQHIGVVPKKVANFISALEAAGGAAKICGAGAVAGDNAGVVLILPSPDIDQRGLATIVQRHGYTLQNIKVDTYGTRIV